MLRQNENRLVLPPWARKLADFARDSFMDEGTANTLWMGSLVVWLLTLIATPITIWIVGYDPLPLVISLGVLAQFAATMLALAGRWDAARILGAFAVVAVGTWAVEYLGHNTGVPFGVYHYTELLQPQVGSVPILIPLAWMMMLGPAWGAAATLLGEKRTLLGFAALSAAAITVWDLYLDPQMVAKGLWVWENPSGYFGIPWVNYGGWLLTATLLTLAIRPGDLPRTRLLIIYTLTWIFQAIGLGIFWGQPGPALVGFAAMGVVAVLAWRKEYARWSSGR